MVSEHDEEFYVRRYGEEVSGAEAWMENVMFVMYSQTMPVNAEV